MAYNNHDKPYPRQDKDSDSKDLSPPPYTTNNTSSSPLPPLPRHPPQPQFAPTPGRFPPEFSMYKASSWGSQRHYYLAAHQASAPLYAVSLHSGWSGQPSVVLHAGPEEACPALATVDEASFSRSSTVTLLPGAGGVGEVGGGQFRFDPAPGSTLGHAMQFSVPVEQRLESFEWRHSRAPEVLGLGGRSSGWKLVRLATDAPAGTGEMGFVGGGATSRSDGREVVAVWAWPAASRSKALKFRFLGSGAGGALGDRWQVAAVATALRIWDRERKARNSAAAGGGGGA
ncbi:hypothetical protein F4810DRAFT_705835 [Camillea tinctor]|nr:hypothetical protein F4810DRAFT_705835 [Camillea tinctor]